MAGATPNDSNDVAYALEASRPISCCLSTNIDLLSAVPI